jgi:hypothetical protein
LPPRRLIDDPAATRRDGRSARRAAETTFDIDTITDEFVERARRSAREPVDARPVPTDDRAGEGGSGVLIVLLLGAALLVSAVFAWFYVLEANGRRHTIFNVVAATFLFEAIVTPEVSAVPVGPAAPRAVRPGLPATRPPADRGTRGTGARRPVGSDRAGRSLLVPRSSRST